MLNGFAGWFKAQLSPSVLLDTAPHQPETHWRQTYMPFYPIEVKEGDKVQVDYEISECEANWRYMGLSLQIDSLKIDYVVT